MSDSQWLWDPLAVCQMGPLREDKSCCGITQKGNACKLTVKKETLKEGRHKLNNLARSPFDLSTLDSQLDGIVFFFLCKRWHQERQQNDVKQRWFNAAVRNQVHAQTSPRHLFSPSTAEEVDDIEEESAGISSEPHTLSPPIWDIDEITFPGLPAPAWLEVSQPPGREVTSDMLAMDRVPWDVSPNDPAILSINNEHGGLHCIQIHSFDQGSCPDGEVCPICFEEDSDDPVMLQCDACKGVVHLGCMDGWLAHRLPGNNTSCPTHRCHGSFSALLSSSVAGDVTSESITETPLEVIHIAGGSGVPTVPSQPRSLRLARRSDRFPVSIPSSSSVVRRSARQRRVPDRFRP